jgi:hypothetical protein
VVPRGLTTSTAFHSTWADMGAWIAASTRALLRAFRQPSLPASTHACQPEGQSALASRARTAFDCLTRASSSACGAGAVRRCIYVLHGSVTNRSVPSPGQPPPAHCPCWLHSCARSHPLGTIPRGFGRAPCTA